jgi:zinc/manganese transport system permease protein
MIDVVALLWPPFLVALCLIGIHTYFGIQVLARNVIFVDLALAQIAALGTTMAFMLGHPGQGLATYFYSLGFTLLAAFLLAFTRGWSGRISQEALIGVIYVVAAAAAILMIDRAPQGAEHLKQILTGNILVTGMAELAAIVPIYLAIGALHWALRDRLAFFPHPQAAQPREGEAGGAGPARGRGSWLWEFVFYATFGVVVTSSVALAGVLLVFSFLIMPAAVGVLFGDTLQRQLAIGWAVGTLASAVGLAASFAGDLPTGATMVCTFGATLALAGLLYALRPGRSRAPWRQAMQVARWCLAMVLVLSALLLMAVPRADHPLLDSIEYLFPAVRQAYLSGSEAATYREAAAFAERYRREQERLNELETTSRAAGQPLDDMLVRRISSFVKSYAEMRRGEEFVQREVRGRARERVRWFVGGTMLLIAFLAAPGLAAWSLAAIRRKP